MDLKKNIKETYDRIQQEEPEIDYFELLELALALYKEEKTAKEVYEILKDEYGDLIKKGVETLAKLTLVSCLTNCKYKDIKDLGDEDFASDIFQSTKDIINSFALFKAGQSDPVQLIENIYNSGIKDVTSKFIKAAQFDAKNIKVTPETFKVAKESVTAHPEVIGKVVYPIITVVCFAEVYKLLEETKRDAAIAHERRLEIEEQCNKAIAIMKQYRMELNEALSDYLTIHNETFNDAFTAMDKAILEEDVNSYIKANASIQEILGYDVQFTNEEEFDALMDSDEAFKL